jgi:hypothetical protein
MNETNENSGIDTYSKGSKRKTAFWIISVILPIAAVVVPILLFLIESKEKEISYEISGRTELVGVHLPSEEVSITYAGKSVSHLELISIKISNSGNIPIKREDFDRPLKIKFKEESEVFVVRVGPSFPNNLRPTIKTEPGLVQITPLLLNPGDNYTIEVITSAKEQEPEIDVRIAGIQFPKFIKRAGIKTPDILQKFRLVALVISFALYAFLFGTLLKPIRASLGIKIQKIEAFIATMSAAFISALLFLDYTKMLMPPKVVDSLWAILPISAIIIYLSVSRRLFERIEQKRTIDNQNSTEL